MYAIRSYYARVSHRVLVGLRDSSPVTGGERRGDGAGRSRKPGADMGGECMLPFAQQVPAMGGGKHLGYAHHSYNFV